MINFKPSPDWDGDVPLTWRNYISPEGKILECSPVIVDPKDGAAIDEGYKKLEKPGCHLP